MLKHIVDFCNKFDAAVEHSYDPSEEEVMLLQYFHMELAKSIIEDLDSNNAKRIAKIILASEES